MIRTGPELTEAESFLGALLSFLGGPRGGPEGGPPETALGAWGGGRSASEGGAVVLGIAVLTAPPSISSSSKASLSEPDNGSSGSARVVVVV